MQDNNSYELICELQSAILNDSLLKVQKLIENDDVDVSYSNYMTAVDCDYIQILKYLLEKSKNPLDYAEYSLGIAAHIGRKKSIQTIMTFLMENKEKYGKNELDSVIIKAVHQAINLDVVKCIVDNYEQ